MATRAFKIMVDQWGSNDRFTKGTTILVNDDDREKVQYSIGGEDPRPFAGDIPWAIENGTLVEIDRDDPERVAANLPFPTGRLPIGNEMAQERPATPEVMVPSGSAEDADPTIVKQPTPEEAPGQASGATSQASGAVEGQGDEELTPAQKAARTRAANQAANQA